MAVRPKACAATCLGAAFALIAGSALAQTPQPLGFGGRWAMVSAKSHFAEGVTGPAPASADLDITKDDGATMAWTLVEHDGAVVDASEFGNARLDGSPSRIVVDGVFAPVAVKRSGPHGVEIASNLGAGAGQSIHIELIKPDVLTIEEKLVSPSGKVVEQHLEFLRAKD